MLPRLMRYAAESMRNLRLRPAELERVQSGKLRRMLQFSYDNVPYYHELFRRTGVRPEDIRSIRGLRAIPTLAKKTLSQNAPGRMVPRGARVIRRATTSGTTGPPLQIPYSPGFSDMRLALVFRRSWVVGVRPWHRGVTLWTGQILDADLASILGTSMGMLRSTTFGGGDPRVMAIRQLGLSVARGGWGAAAARVCGFRPDVIYARPSHARRLGRFLSAGRGPLRPRAVLTAGEFLSAGVRDDIESMFGCSVFDIYGSKEFGGLGFECPQHSGVHLNSDCFAFEVLKDGEQISTGEEGEIVITGLHNEAMPLLRYEQGDRVELGEEGRCDCGSYLPRLRSVQGRLDDGLVTSFGSRVPPGLVCASIESGVGLRDYQLVQKSLTTNVLKALPCFLEKRTLERVRGALTALLGSEVEVEPSEWSEDEMPVKYRPVVCEMKH